MTRLLPSFFSTCPLLCLLLLTAPIAAHADAPLLKDDAKCAVGVSKSFEKLSSARSKALQKCLKLRAAKGGTVAECMAAAADKLAKAEGRTLSVEAKKCLVDPPFGTAGAGRANRAALQADELVGDLFGGLDSSIEVFSQKSDATRCQLAIARDVSRCQATWIKTYNACKKKGLGKGTITSPAQLAVCLGPDARGKIAKACAVDSAKWTRTLSKTCAEVDLQGAFPLCRSDSAAGLSQCLADAAACRVCLAVGAADGIGGACATCPDATLFVTSTLHRGDEIGGQDGADAICRARAADAGLRGNFRAWLSTAAQGGGGRIDGDGWSRPDGVTVAASREALLDGVVVNPIRIDESGGDVVHAPGGAGEAWTGTRSQGGELDLDHDCRSWADSGPGVLGRYGLPSAGGFPWTSRSSGTCTESRRLYCGAGGRAPTPAPPTAGREMFLTQASWTPGGGKADADLFCQAEAAAEGLASAASYAAVLADDGKSLSASLGGCSDDPLVRLDGTPLLAKGCDLFGLGPDASLLTAPHLRSDGEVYDGFVFVWTGASHPSAAGTAATTCNGWTSSASVDTVVIGLAGDSGPGWFNAASTARCNQPRRLYCRR